eukprot:SAG11_NODE_682_length_7769_cov_45.167275_2_plen_205_part_00
MSDQVLRPNRSTHYITPPALVPLVTAMLLAVYLVSSLELPYRIGRYIASIGVVRGQLWTVRFGLFLAIGPKCLPSGRNRLTAKLDPHFGFDCDGNFTPLCGRESGLHGTARALASAAFVLDQLVLLCMVESSPSSRISDIDSFLMDRLAKLLVRVRRRRVKLEMSLKGCVPLLCLRLFNCHFYAVERVFLIGCSHETLVRANPI